MCSQVMADSNVNIKDIYSTVQPVKLPKRRFPVATMKPLKEELKSLVDRKIIARVDCCTDWISSMVSMQKPNGRPRIFIDTRPLNRALKLMHFPLPTIDDNFARHVQGQSFHSLLCEAWVLAYKVGWGIKLFNHLCHTFWQATNSDRYFKDAERGTLSCLTSHSRWIEGGRWEGSSRYRHAATHRR